MSDSGWMEQYGRMVRNIGDFQMVASKKLEGDEFLWYIQGSPLRGTSGSLESAQRDCVENLNRYCQSVCSMLAT